MHPILTHRQIRNVECKLWRISDRLLNLELAANTLGFKELQKAYSDARIIIQDRASFLERTRKAA